MAVRKAITAFSHQRRGLIGGSWRRYSKLCAGTFRLVVPAEARCNQPDHQHKRPRDHNEHVHRATLSSSPRHGRRSYALQSPETTFISVPACAHREKAAPTGPPLLFTRDLLNQTVAVLRRNRVTDPTTPTPTPNKANPAGSGTAAGLKVTVAGPAVASNLPLYIDMPAALKI